LARIVIVGAGVVGTALAVAAVDRGHEVVQIERDAEPRGATVRSFGLLWISGRAPGRELDVALASRARRPRGTRSGSSRRAGPRGR